MNTAHPTYAAFARIGLALFEQEDDVSVLKALQETSRYSGRHSRILHTLVAWVITSRFSEREDFADILAQRNIPSSMPESLQQHYPRTAAALRRGK